MTIKTKKLVFLSLFAAMLCIVSPFSLPIGVIPISLATFAMYIAASVLGASGTISVLVYIFIGAVGVPVFSGGLGGIDRLVGPTGGYIVGFIPCTLIAGLIIDRFENRKIAYPIAMIAGTAVLYALGTIWFIILMGKSGTPYTLGAALMTCVVPFLIGDAIKIAAASTVGFVLRKTLYKNTAKIKN